MSEAKFTPGPWKVEAVFIAQQTCAAICFNEYRLNGFGVGGTTQVDRGEAEANARLIAAAPELYALLGRALDTIEMLWHPQDHNRRANREAWLTEARGALAKARGEAPVQSEVSA